MKRTLVVVLGMLVVAAIVATWPTYAGPGGCTASPVLVAIPGSSEAITISSTAIGFTSTKFAPSGQLPAELAIVSIESNAIRVKADGTLPTAAVGTPIEASRTFSVCGTENIRNTKMIRQSSDATASVDYYRSSN